MLMRRSPAVQRVADSRVEPPMRGEAAIEAIEAPFLWLDRALERLIHAEYNPLRHAGAIANVTLLVAVVSGVLMLFWYSASVHSAHASLEALRGSFLGQLVRSLHRYSSDACMFFVVLHALRLFGARRFAGARWLAWVTGLVLVGSLWVVGWLGYWLVWDEPARQIALGTARAFDVLPIFAEPMSRSFLTDHSVQSLLFFIVFFVHMLLPLGMAVALWLHITRLSRPRFFTGAKMTAAIIVSLVALSIALPAASGRPAHMLVLPDSIAIDAFYVLPIAITDRLSGGAIWALTLTSGVILFSLPWTLSRGRAEIAKVDTSKCRSCRRCATDCPYDAVRMVPRTDDKKLDAQAQIDGSKCVGCGICAGSCDSAAIGPPTVSAIEARARIDEWMGAAKGEYFAFVCARSGGGSLEVDPSNGTSPLLPGYRIMPVPCIGWVHALTIERAIRHGASGVLLVSCGTTEPTYREGPTWAAERIAGRRDPRLRTDRVDPAKVREIDANGAATADVIREAERFRRGQPAGERARRARSLSVACGLAVFAILTIGALSQARYSPPAALGPELVVSFRHAGSNQEHCRDVSAEQNATLPPHMRRPKICERGRAPVRLRVEIDGAVRLDKSFAPKGLHGDMPSMAIEKLSLSAGSHEVSVAIGETYDPSEWRYTDRRTIRLEPRARAVVLFDRATGFTWDGN